jgi:CheY-like chemotaxis protein
LWQDFLTTSKVTAEFDICASRSIGSRPASTASWKLLRPLLVWQQTQIHSLTRGAQVVTGKVALLLEDEALIALNVEDNLKSAGFEVVTYSIVAEGLSWLDLNTPTLAILDISLRDGDCDAAAELLSARHVPFIVYSAAAHEARDRPVFSAGRWLPKPATDAELEALVGELSVSSQTDADRRNSTLLE